MNTFWKRLNCYGMNSPTGQREIESRPTTVITTIIALPITDILDHELIRPQSRTKPSTCRVQIRNRHHNLSTKSDLSALQTLSTIRRQSMGRPRWVPRIVPCSTTLQQLRQMRQSRQVQAPHSTRSTASRALKEGSPKEFRPLKIGGPRLRESRMEALAG